MNISSAIVHANSNAMDQVRGRLGLLAGVEIHASSDEGRFIISIESATDRATADTFEAIQGLDGVLAASLVYSHFEADPDSEICGADDQDVMPRFQGDRQ